MFLDFYHWLNESSATLISSMGGDHVKRLLAKREKDAAKEAVSRLYARMQPLLDKTKVQYDNTLVDIAKRLKLTKYRVASRIKPLKSVINKVVERGKPIEGIGDFIAGSIYLDGHDEPEKVYKAVLRKFGNRVVEHEAKTRGGDQYGYHGAYHVDLIMPSGLQTELQIMTKKLIRYKDEAHKIYDKNRAKTRADIDPGELARSRKLFRIGNIPNRLREEIEHSEVDDKGLLESLIVDLLNEDFSLIEE